MKIRNIAFFGVMAAILGASGAARADTTTIIASQAYVDAKDALKQNILNSGANGNVTFDGDTTNGNVITNVSANGNGTITFTKGSIASTDYVTNGDNALSLTDSTTKAPTIHAVQGMAETNGNNGTGLATISNGVATIGNGSDTKVPTTKYMAETFKALDHKNLDDGTGTKPVIAVTQSDGQVSVQKGTITAAGIADGAVTIPKTNFTVKQAASGEVTEHLEGEHRYGIIENLASRDVKSWATASAQSEDPDERKLGELRTTGVLDDMIPTIAAVEKRVKEAETTAAGNYADKDLSNITTAGNTVIDNRIDTKINALDVGLTSGVTGVTMGGSVVNDDIGKAVVAIQETDGKLTNVALGTVGTKGIADNAVTNAKLADDAVDTAEIKDSAVTSAKVKNGDLKYAVDMNNVLMDINTHTTATCNKGNPCVLTYYIDNNKKFVRWTNMDTDSTNADVTAGTGEDLG